MCKLLIMTGIDEPIFAELFMQHMAIPMSKSNKHGIGYAAVNSKGELFGERWLYNELFMDHNFTMTEAISKKLKAFENRLPVGSLEVNYNSFGTKDLDDMKTVIMHTRFATSEKGMKNTHPFVYEDTALIHNGTIRNAFSTTTSTGLDVNKVSTCDSEAALQTYLANKVQTDLDKHQEWLDQLEGGYAFGIIGTNTQGNRILDVVKGSSFLYRMKIEGLGTVFTTDKDDAVEVMKFLGLDFLEEPKLVLYNTMYRFDAMTGEELNKLDFKSRGYVTTSYSNSGTVSHLNRGTSNQNSFGWSGNSSSKAEEKSVGVQGERPEDFVIADKYDLEDGSVNLNRFHSDDSLEEFKRVDGTWDYAKVAKYLNTGDPFVDRLEMYDIVYNKNLLYHFELLDKSDQDEIWMTDYCGEFRQARKLLQTIIKEYKKKVM